MRDLHKYISREFGIPQVDLDLLEIEPKVLALIPGDVARSLSVIPVFLAGEKLLIAMVNPTDVAAIDHLGKLTGLSIEVVAALAAQLVPALERHYPR